MKRDRDDVIYIRAAAFEGLHGAELVLRAHQQQLRLARTACRLGSQVRGVEHVERPALRQPRARTSLLHRRILHFFWFSAARKKTLPGFDEEGRQREVRP